MPRRLAPSAGGIGPYARHLAVCALVLLAAAAGGAARADSANTPPKPKASSFAPHPSRSHVYGTPVAKPILHKRKKSAHPAPAPAAPIK